MAELPTPLDRAALAVLEPLVRDLRAGRATILKMGGADTEDESSIALQWAEVIQDGDARPTAPAGARPAPPPDGPAFFCPECSRELEAAGCTACGWQPPAEPPPPAV